MLGKRTPNLVTAYYLTPARFPTTTRTGVAVELLIPAPVGTAVDVRVSEPLRAGFQLHVATILGDVPEVRRLIHPGMRTLLTLKVTFEETVMFAVI